jgi:hypothetical protein
LLDFALKVNYNKAIKREHKDTGKTTMNTTKQFTAAELETWKKMSWINQFFAAAPVECVVIIACSLGSIAFLALELAYQFGMIF